MTSRDTENKAKLNIYEKLSLAASLYYRDIAGGWMYKTKHRRIQEHIRAKELYKVLLE